VSTQIYPLIKPELKVCVVGKSSGEIAEYFNLNQATLEQADGAMFIVSAVDGITAGDIEIWNTARELYVPSMVLISELSNGETDFDDMSAIAGRILDPVQTPYLVLHDDAGNPTALIDLETLNLSDYSTGSRVVRESDPEHKVPRAHPALRQSRIVCKQEHYRRDLDAMPEMRGGVRGKTASKGGGGTEDPVEAGLGAEAECRLYPRAIPDENARFIQT